MPRGPRKWSEESIEKLQREGRGMGRGEQYLPWINVTEVSSLGRSRRAAGIKIRREHHFLSDVEWNLFLLLEHSPDVIDIREQFPLDRDITLEIAASLGIHHPCYPGTRIPVVMTTDFLVTRIGQEGKPTLEAFDTKVDQDAEQERSLEKLQIHRACFKGMFIRHHIVLNSAIPRNQTQNIEWARGAVPKAGEIETFVSCLEEATGKIMRELPQYSRRNITLADYCQDFDHRNGYESGCGLRAARQMIAHRKILTDLSNPSLPTCPLSAFQLAEASLNLQVAEAA